MTYEELTEIGNAVFDEYLPKVSGKLRKVFLDALFTELEEHCVIDIEDKILPVDDSEVTDEE